MARSSSPAVEKRRESKAWSELLHRIERCRANRDFEANEVTYKLEVAAKVNMARERFQSGTADWADLLRRAFTSKSNNLTDYRDYDPFLKWMSGESDQCRGALQALWSAGGPPEERLQGFCDQVPAAVLGTLGPRLNIGTFLLMAEDARRLPPTKITPFRDAWKLAGRGNGPAGAGPGAVYGEILRFLDELVRDGSNWPVPLRDRLEAQGAVWVATRPDRGKNGTGAALLRRRPKGLLPAARQELLDPSKAWWGGRRGRLADRPRYSISVSLGVVPRWYSRVVEVPVRIEVAAGFVAPGASEPPRLQPSWPPGGSRPAHG